MVKMRKKSSTRKIKERKENQKGFNKERKGK